MESVGDGDYVDFGWLVEMQRSVGTARAAPVWYEGCRVARRGTVALSRLSAACSSVAEAFAASGVEHADVIRIRRHVEDVAF